MEVSSEDVILSVEPRVDWKTIIGAAVGSGAGLIVLALLAIVIRISYVITRRRPNPAGHRRLPIRDGAVDENAHLLGNGPAGIGGNIISKGHP